MLYSFAFVSDVSPSGERLLSVEDYGFLIKLLGSRERRQLCR